MGPIGCPETSVNTNPRQVTRQKIEDLKFCKHFLNFFINPLKTKRICFIDGLSAYRAVNTLHFGYKNQSLNVL
jgi:hypothetical protein